MGIPITFSLVVSLDKKLSEQIEKLIAALAGIDGGSDPAILTALEPRATALEALTKPKEN